MASLTLKVLVSGSNATKTMQFDPSLIIYDACRIIRDKLPDASSTNANEYGLFLSDDDPKKGVWLEPGRTLEYYLLRNGDLLEYKKKHRILRVRMLDGAIKTMQVDDSHTVSQLMITICSKIGITNHEEYSLVRDLPDAEKEKTLTLRRDKSIAKDQKKMDEMKKKLHTDDELNWLDHTKTLREQAVEPSETLLLRRKYFFSDQNVDARDPIQLNLLYVQTRDAILKGAHPINQDEAVQFGGIQCQIQFGDHVEGKHRPGFLDLKEFLPKEYVKVKGIEKKIFLEHKKLQGISEVDSKVKYNNLARSLKTYGIAFFLVKEKLKGKNRLVPRLLGVTKDSVVRVDEKTKEILKTWPLTTVRRWAASPNSFTLDFGDYSDSYYSVQTMEGEQISQLISGYIDIILKRKAAKDRIGTDGEEESTMYEDSVAPARATIIQHQMSKVSHANTGSVALNSLMRSGENGDAGLLNGGSVQKAFHTQAAPQITMLTQSQRALLGTINEGLTTVDESHHDLSSKAELPPLGTDAASSKWKETTKDLSRQKVGSQLSAMNAATAQMVTLTSAGPDETDFTAVGSAVQTISANIGEFSKDVRMLAALDESSSSGEKILDAARRLAGAFSCLLTAAQPGSQEPRQTLLNAATKVGEAGQEVMCYVEPPTPTDDSYKDTLLALAKAVANATATLVMKAKGVASTCDNQSDQNIIIGAATQCALSTSQLVACTKVVAPTLSSSSECQGQLVEAAKQVAKSVDDVVETAQNICDNDIMLKDLGEAATSVTVTLDDMMQHVRKASNRNIADNDEVDVILSTTDRLYNSVGDTPEMVKQARRLALATSQLVNALKTEAESHQDTDQQRKLLAAAKLLADATAKMVEAAKGCASTPHDPTQQEALMRAAEELKKVTNDAAHTKSRTSVFTILQEAVKRATSASTQLINASGAAGKSNRNQSSQQQLMMMCKQVAEDSIPKAIQSLRTTLKSPDSPNSLALLIAAAHDMLQPCSKMLSSAKASVPTVGDQAAAMSLSNASSILANAIVDLRQAVTKSRESFTPHDLDAALLRVRDLEHDLVEAKRSARERGLAPLPGETLEVCASKLGSTSKVVGSTLARLLTAAAQGNESYTGQAAKETAESLSTLMQVIRGVASTSSPDLQQEVLDLGMEVLEKSEKLIEEAKLAVINPSNSDNQARLAMVAKGISQALNNCVGCLPGLKEVDDAVRYISTVSIQLSQPQLNTPTATKSNYSEVQIHLTSKAADLNSATSDVVTAAVSASSHQVATASDRFSKAYEQLVVTGLEAARKVPKDADSQEKIVTGLRGVSSVSGRLLIAAKSMLVDPNAPNAKNQLTQAARAVTESINNLISVCTISSPGQKECDNALRQIEMMKPLLQEPNEPIMDSNYYDCLEGVITKSKNLADMMTGMSSQAKQKDFNSFCTSVSEFASSVCGIVEYVAQAAYLIGASDPASEPGRPGLVDQSQFFRSQQAIQSACQNLTNPANNQQQILSAAATIAKNTSSLCNTCRLASSKTNNPVAKRHFVQSAKEVANNTANLVRAIKNLDKEFTEANRQACSEAARPLLQAVESLSVFAASSVFVGIPAKISSEARKAQEPITAAGLLIIESACNMLTSAKQLAACPKDPAYFQGYSSHSHFLSEAIKRMVTSIKEGRPGGVECENALQHISILIQQIDSASLSPGSMKYDPQMQLSASSNHQELILNSARQLFDHIDPIASAAKSEPESLGHMVTSATTYLEPLTAASLSYTSKIFNTRSKETLIDQTRTVIEAMQNLIMIVREAGGNQKTTTTSAHHSLIEESSESTKETLLELIQTVQNISTSSGVMNGLVDDVTRAMTMLNDQNFSVKRRSYVDHQTDIVRLSKQMARNAQEMMSKSSDGVSDLGNLATQISRDFCALALDAREAADCSADIQTSLRIKSVVQQLGNSCVDLIQDAGNFQSKPEDEFAKNQLTEHARKVLESISNLLSTFHSMARGTQACINASSTVSGIIGDLDTTIMFASAGTLNSDEKESFSDHRENILKTAKALVEDTKTLVSGAAMNQEMLAGAAQNAVLTITKLADCVKHGAASLGSEQTEAQVLLINAVKDVASALADLIDATKNASGKLPSESSMAVLKDSAKVMVTNVTSLLKTVKTVEDEAVRGTQALESSIEVIGQEIKSYTSVDHVETKVTADDLIRLTRPVTTATARAVAAGNSCQQSDVISAANLGRKAITDLLKACKGGSVGVTDPSIKSKLLEAGRACGVAFRELLVQINQALQQPSPQHRQTISSASKEVAVAINDIVNSAEAIKAHDWMESVLEGTTESELLIASNSIEAALLKLNNAQSQVKRQQEGVTGGPSCGSDIFDAARSIAAATCNLVKAASMAQRELVAQGKLGDVSGASDLEDDSQWSQGLVSAARLVAAATQNLCDAANAMMQGCAGEEKLISSAKQVASSTAQLLVACKVKADPSSVAMRRLQSAGNAVKRATEALVQEAQKFKNNTSADADVTVDERMVSGMAQLIMAQEDILIKEKQLESARKKLELMRRAKYKDREWDSTDSGTDF